MLVDTSPLIMNDLVRYTRISERLNWKEGLEIFELFDYEDRLFKSGPWIVSIQKVENEPDFRRFEYFLPINFPIELTDKDSGVDFVENLILENAVWARFAENSENIYSFDRRLRNFLMKEKDVDLEEITYVIITELNSEEVFDVWIPIKELKN